MIKDVRSELTEILNSQFQQQLELLPTILDLFGPEATSAALGALAERLVMAATGAQPAPRNNKGFDLCRGDEKIEVKSRYIATWGKSLQFNLRKSNSVATTAYYIVWDWNGNKPILLHAFAGPVEYLRSRWPNNQSGYWMRTDLHKLLSHFNEPPRP